VFAVLDPNAERIHAGDVDLQDLERIETQSETMGLAPAATSRRFREAFSSASWGPDRMTAVGTHLTRPRSGRETPLRGAGVRES
jgi:hypothetical protein